MNSILKNTNFVKVALIACAFCLLPDIANAAGTDVKSKLQTILDVVQGCGVAVVTGTIIWAGFKVGWQGESMRNVQGPLIGGILVGTAAYFAGLLVNG